MRWLGRWNKKKAIQSATIKDMAGKGKMPLMYRIKCPAKQADMLVFFGENHASGAGFPSTVDDEFLGGQFL